MHQAECADSTARPATSGGICDKSTGSSRIAYLSPFPVSELHGPSDDLGASFARLKTLLKAVSEAADEGTGDRGIYFRMPGVWPKERFEHLGNLVDLAFDELERAVSFLDAIDGVVAGHIEEKAA